MNSFYEIDHLYFNILFELIQIPIESDQCSSEFSFLFVLVHHDYVGLQSFIENLRLFIRFSFV